MQYLRILQYSFKTVKKNFTSKHSLGNINDGAQPKKSGMAIENSHIEQN